MAFFTRVKLFSKRIEMCFTVHAIILLHLYQKTKKKTLSSKNSKMSDKLESSLKKCLDILPLPLLLLLLLLLLHGICVVIII